MSKDYCLYYSPGACSFPVHVVLQHIKADFEIERIALSKGENRTDEFQKINPRMQVPVLKTKDGSYIREAFAILLHLLDNAADQQLLPKSGIERVRALEWLSFTKSSLHHSYVGFFLLIKNRIPADSDAISVVIKRIQFLWDDVEAHLEREDAHFLANNTLSIADIDLTTIAKWSKGLPQDINFGPRTKKLFKAVLEMREVDIAAHAETIDFDYLEQ